MLTLNIYPINFNSDATGEKLWAKKRPNLKLALFLQHGITTGADPGGVDGVASHPPSLARLYTVL